jgi:hypothetical protein
MYHTFVPVGRSRFEGAWAKNAANIIALHVE